MIESWRALQTKGEKVGAIIMDLSKALDTLNHELLFKKLQAYGFDKKSLSFIESYFTNRKQRTKIGDSFSKYQRIITGVPQGSILRRHFFNFQFFKGPFLRNGCPYGHDFWLVFRYLCETSKKYNSAIFFQDIAKIILI